MCYNSSPEHQGCIKAVSKTFGENWQQLESLSDYNNIVNKVPDERDDTAEDEMTVQCFTMSNSSFCSLQNSQFLSGNNCYVGDPSN